MTSHEKVHIPQVMATLDKLRGARYLSTLDLKNGYWQIPLSPESRPVTALPCQGKDYSNRIQWYHRVYTEIQRGPEKRSEFKIEDERLYRLVLHNLDFKETAASEQ